MVDFTLSEEQTMMRDLAREFARNEVRPLADRHFKRGEDVPAEERDALLVKANALRLLDYYFPTEVGGLGIDDHLTGVLIGEELSWGNAGLAVAMGSTGLAATGIQMMGTDEQRRRWLPRFCNPDNLARKPGIGAFCLSEPGAGSHVSGLTTTAVRDGDSYVINGGKQWITNGGIADVYVVVAQTMPELQGDREKAMGLAGFVVEAGAEGLTTGVALDKWGVRASNTAEVHFDNVRVPVDHRLGGEQPGGMLGVYHTLEATRVGVGAGALGIARAAFEEALAYARERKQKRTIIDFQGIGHKLAEMEVKINAARLLTWKAAWMANQGHEMTRGEGSQAKLFASETAVQVCLDAIQIHGGNGFIKDYNVGMWLNDAIVYRIWEGTSEIQRNTIVRYLKSL